MLLSHDAAGENSELPGGCRKPISYGDDGAMENEKKVSTAIKHLEG